MAFVLLRDVSIDIHNYVTRSGKTGFIHTFCILRNMNLKY